MMGHDDGPKILSMLLDTLVLSYVSSVHYLKMMGGKSAVIVLDPSLSGALRTCTHLGRYPFFLPLSSGFGFTTAF